VTNLTRPGAARLLLTPVIVALGLLALYFYIHLTPGRLTDSIVLNQHYVTVRIFEHVQVSAISFGFAAVIGVPVGILLAQGGRLLRLPVFAVANLGQALPSIGILALGFVYIGLGVQGAVIALILYALLPILRNTVVGLHGVEPSVEEAARGMGMTPRQLLLQVRLPLASPVIFAGLRVSLVLVIGTATLANFVGGGGLGDLIAASDFYHPRPILVGAVLVSALALLADWALGLLERLLTPRVEEIGRT
jgi:ABC-type proline/glycine betaine transport system permease subunit